MATGPTQTAPDNAAPHVFTPRPHPPHVAVRPQPVDLSRLPKLRLDECFTPRLVTVAQSGQVQVIRNPSKGGTGYSSNIGGLSGVGSTGRNAGSASPAPTPKAAKKPSAAPSPSPSEGYGYSFQDRAGAPQASPTTPAPLPAPTAAPSKGASASPQRAEVAKKDAAPAIATDSEVAAVETPSAYHDFGASIYLSNDDTMSLSSAQRVIYAIDRFLPIPPEHIRPHELLNYFSFDTAPIAPTDDFSVKAEIEPKPGKPQEFTLGLSVSGRGFSKADRRNAALTFVIDRSGSMQEEGRMEYLKRGLLRMTSELKRGDIVNVVAFDHQVCTPIENFVVGRDPMTTLTSTIDRLAPRGSTDLDSGLRTGYALADRAYQPAYTNRVLLITDALANTGVTDPEMMAMVSAHFDKRRIRLSGVGVGREFNDGLLDRLTERGKGAYVFLGSPAEVDAVFGARFVSLIETTANDVHFKLQLPPSLRMNVFYGEESSTVKEDVQAVHYFAGTSQLFLSDLMSRSPELRTTDSVMLSVEYEHPETGAKQFEDFAFNLGEISGDATLVKKGRLVMSFIDGLADTVQSSPERSDYRIGGWIDANAAEQCSRGHASLAEQSRNLGPDPEVTRVVGLWDQYCSRYEPARSPVRRTPPQGRDVWPSAQR
jgi:Ca-activated chloride channel homolog